MFDSFALLVVLLSGALVTGFVQHMSSDKGLYTKSMVSKKKLSQ